MHQRRLRARTPSAKAVMAAGVERSEAFSRTADTRPRSNPPQLLRADEQLLRAVEQLRELRTRPLGVVVRQLGQDRIGQDRIGRSCR